MSKNCNRPWDTSRLVVLMFVIYCIGVIYVCLFGEFVAASHFPLRSSGHACLCLFSSLCLCTVVTLLMVQMEIIQQILLYIILGFLKYLDDSCLRFVGMKGNLLSFDKAIIMQQSNVSLTLHALLTANGCLNKT